MFLTTDVVNTSVCQMSAPLCHFALYKCEWLQWEQRGFGQVKSDFMELTVTVPCNGLFDFKSV